MKLVILDRDGVINEDSDDFIRSVDEWVPLPGSIDAIARLSRAGFHVVIATNQSGLGRGYFSLDDLEAMHGKLRALVEDAGGVIDGIYFCPHRPDDNCNCRKPAPGLLDAIRADMGNISLDGVPVVGDSLRDLEAGVARGCVPILVRTGKGRETEEKLRPLSPPLGNARVFDDLSTAADYLIGSL